MGWHWMTVPKIAFHAIHLFHCLLETQKWTLSAQKQGYSLPHVTAKPAHMRTAMNATMEAANLRKSPSKPKPTSTQWSPPQCQLVEKMEPDSKKLTPSWPSRPFRPSLRISSHVLITKVLVANCRPSRSRTVHDSPYKPSATCEPCLSSVPDTSETGVCTHSDSFPLTDVSSGTVHCTAPGVLVPFSAMECPTWHRDIPSKLGDYEPLTGNGHGKFTQLAEADLLGLKATRAESLYPTAWLQRLKQLNSN